MKLDTYFSFYSLLRIFLQAIKLKGIHIIKKYFHNNASSKMTSSQIAEILARYGSVDVKPLNSKGESLVSVSNYRTERDILLAFQNDTRLQVMESAPRRQSCVF